MKKTTRLTGVVVIAMALMIAFSGVALASPSVPKTPETEIFDITTNIKCNGTVVESQGLSLEIDSKNLLDNPPLAAGEVYGKIGYNEKMIGLSGDTIFTKIFMVDTSAAPNLNVTKTIGYTSDDLGSLSHDEQVGMNIIAAGKAKKPGKAALCPFGPAGPAGIPAAPGSCEEVNAYSKMAVVTDVAATTMTEVGITTGPGVSLLYGIGANGTGTVAAGVSAFVEDGRRTDIDLGSRWTYREKSIAYGDFEFHKSIEYTSNPP